MKKYKFIYNEISVLITVGMLGFLFAIILLGGKGCSSGTIHYKEIVLSNKDSIVNSIYSARLRQLKDTLLKMEADTAKFGKKIPLVRKALFNATLDSLAFKSGNADTSLKYFTKLISVKRDSLSHAITAEDWTLHLDLRKELKFVYTDTSMILNNQSVSETKILYLKRSEYKDLMSFFSHNSMAGFWLIFSVAQMTLWFLVVALMYGMLKSLKERVTDVPKDLLSVRNWGLSSVQPFLFFSFFGVVFYYFLIDTTVIKDHYFLEGFNNKLLTYAIFGYITAVSCFGIYLLTSMSLDQLNEGAKKSGKTIAANPEIKESYLALKKTFEASFLATAIILSVFVLWMGVMFHAVNKTEIMQFYSIYSGKDFLSYDNVYLVATIHTIILMLFYIPVKIKFNSMKITEDEKAQNAASGNKILGNLYESIISILVTASPLLASLLQKLLSGFVGN